MNVVNERALLLGEFHESNDGQKRYLLMLSKIAIFLRNYFLMDAAHLVVKKIFNFFLN